MDNGYCRNDPFGTCQAWLMGQGEDLQDLQQQLRGGPGDQEFRLRRRPA